MTISDLEHISKEEARRYFEERQKRRAQVHQPKKETDVKHA